MMLILSITGRTSLEVNSNIVDPEMSTHLTYVCAGAVQGGLYPNSFTLL